MVPIFFVYFALVSIAGGGLHGGAEASLCIVGWRSWRCCSMFPDLFILLNAEFLWAVQIIVYAGAILVLYLFVLMLIESEVRRAVFPFESYLYSSPRCHLGRIRCSCSCSRPSVEQREMRPPQPYLRDGATYAVGIKMFSEYLIGSSKSSVCSYWAPLSERSCWPRRRRVVR